MNGWPPGSGGPSGPFPPFSPQQQYPALPGPAPAPAPMIGALPPSPPSPPPPPAPSPQSVNPNTLRVCFSKSFWCSGCNPCDACLAVVRTQVLPPAMQAGGFAGSTEQAQRFFEGYTFQGWGGWRQRLQVAIQQRQMPVFDEARILAALALLAETEARAAAEASAAAAVAAPPTPSVGDPFAASREEPMAMAATQAPYGPTVSPASPLSPSPATTMSNVEPTPATAAVVTPLTAEDIAAIASFSPSIPSAASDAVYVNGASKE